MRIYQLTSIGNSIASSPQNTKTDGVKILYFLRRHGWRATDDQIKSFVIPDESRYMVAMNNLVRAKAVQVVG